MGVQHKVDLHGSSKLGGSIWGFKIRWLYIGFKIRWLYMGVQNKVALEGG